MFSLIIPLFYQLMQAYKPVIPSITPITETQTVTPFPTIVPSSRTVSIALFGDSMINTLSTPILQKSLQNYFPNIKFNFLNYGYSATTLDKAINNLNFVVSQNPNIIVIESFAYNNFGNTTTGIEKQTELLTQTVNTLKSNLPSAKIVISATIAPNSIVFGNGITDLNLTALDKIERTKTIRLYLTNAVKFARDHQLPLADAYSNSLISNEGYLPFIDTASHLHPSDYGQQFFSDTLAKTIFENKLID